MNSEKKKKNNTMGIEILSPAGSMESLVAALRCGADAVYIGGKNFSARANAGNFSIEEIKQAAEICHVYGSRLHIAVNTVCFDNEIKFLAKYIEQVADCGVDAFIVQDLGVNKLLKNIAPDIERHASTQMTIHSAEGAKWAKDNGFSRVVLARELSLDEIARICEVEIDIECFVHGALCMSVSGQCYMSAMIGGRSANRGNCAQSCRLPFSADNREYYALSLKDMSLAKHIKQMQSVGVKSFKIEGRMKRPEYVAVATKAMKEASEGKTPDIKLLQDVFSRSGFTDGYLTGSRKNMFGIRRKEDVLNAKDAFPLIHEYYRKPYKARKVDFFVTVKKNIPVKVTACDSSGNKSEAVSDIPQSASKKQVTFDEIKKQFSKLGDTVYSFGRLECSLDNGLFVPSSVFNSMRREAVKKLDDMQKSKFEKNLIIKEFDLEKITLPEKKYEKPYLVASVRDILQLEEVLKYKSDIKKIAVPVDIASQIEKYSDKSIFLISMPRFMISESNTIDKMHELKNIGFNNFLCGNVAYIRICEKLNVNMYADFGMNITNSFSANVLSDMNVESLLLSPEMKFSEIRDIKCRAEKGIFAYGRFPLMLTRNCPVKNQLGTCSKCRHELVDRTKRRMKVYCRYGMTEIFNSEKIYLANKLDSIKNVDFLFLSFTDESKSEIAKIIFDYTKGSENALKECTNGLYYRGIK